MTPREIPADRWLVFVSHSAQDTWIAKQIAREIESCGASTFLDESHVDAGADFEEDILQWLERTHELVVLLTPWALERPYVWSELGAAWGRRKRIVGLLHGVTPGDLQTSIVSCLKPWVELLEMNARVLRCELPIHVSA